MPTNILVESAVKDKDVTPPKTLFWDLIVKSLSFNFAIVPSPQPSKRSPFNNWVIQVIPKENCFLIGPILLKINF